MGRSEQQHEQILPASGRQRLSRGGDGRGGQRERAVHIHKVWAAPDNTGGLSLMFTGRRYDFETGLYHYRARAYNPSLGRFMQPDPIGTDGGMNLYAYVNNDPYNLRDPMGTCPMCIAALWAAGEFIADTSPVWGPYAAKMGIGFGVGYGLSALSGVQSQEGRIAAGSVGALSFPVGSGLVAAGEALGGATGAVGASGGGAYLAGYTGEIAGQLGDKDSGYRSELDYSESNKAGLATVAAWYLGPEGIISGAEVSGFKATGWAGAAVSSVTTSATGLLGLAGQQLMHGDSNGASFDRINGSLWSGGSMPTLK